MGLQPQESGDLQDIVDAINSDSTDDDDGDGDDGTAESGDPEISYEGLLDGERIADVERSMWSINTMEGEETITIDESMNTDENVLVFNHTSEGDSEENEFTQFEVEGEAVIGLAEDDEFTSTSPSSSRPAQFILVFDEDETTWYIGPSEAF